MTIGLDEPLGVTASESVLLITVSIAGGITNLALSLALAGAFGAPLLLLAVRRRRPATLIAGVCVLMLLVACSTAEQPAPETRDFRYGTSLTEVAAVAGDKEVTISGLPLSGAEVSFSLPVE